MKQLYISKLSRTRTIINFLVLIFFCNNVYSATYTVTSAAFGTTGDGVSLRWAITQANSNAGTHTIAFNIPGIAPHTITLTAALPVLTRANTTIDGTTQPANGFVGVSPKIIIDCGVNTRKGLEIDAANCAVYGLYIKGGSIGIDVTADGVIIGSATKRNVISGNTGSHGIYIHKTSLNGATVKGNYVGVDTTGLVAEGNGNAVGEHGIFVSGTGVDNITIGGTAVGEGNIVSANSGRGINVTCTSGNNFVCSGNYVGLDKNGILNFGNGSDGVYSTTDDASIQNNVISGNAGRGIYLSNNGAMAVNIIRGNYIGVNAAGTAIIANTGTGAEFSGTGMGATLGGATAGQGNIISGNGGSGVTFSGTSVDAIIKGNYIGVDVTGTIDFGNGGDGLTLGSTSNTATVGGVTTPERNIISGNGGDGVRFSGTSPTWTFYNNYIGVDATGTVDLGNDGDGIEVASGTSNTVTIGGSAAGQGNIISGNGANGLKLNSYTSPVYIVRGNKIGTDVTGTQNLGNGNYGIFLNGASDAQIGGTAANQGNIIAYNAYEGIRVHSDDQNDIHRNSIFCNSQVSGIGGIILTSNGNNSIAAPVINTATITTGFVQGTAPANSLVEIFSNDVCCEGKTYVATVTANGAGAWSYTGALSGSINATANLAANGTSQLGNCVATCSTPIPNITGTVSICNGVSTTLTASGGGSYSWNTGATTTAITVSPGVTTTYTVTASNGCGSSAKTQVVTVNALPSAGITGTSTICNGATTTLTGTGGGTYSWNTGAGTTAISVSPSSNTTYTVTVTSGSGCTAVATQAVTVNALPTATMGSTPATCGSSNGTATITATGTATLTYLWSPSGQTTSTAIGLSSGSYNVTVTDGNGCTRSASVSVNSATGPTASLSSQTDVLCTGSATGTATVTGTGGTGTLTYLWSPGGQTTTSVTGLTAGTYIATVTDANGCAHGQSVTITEPTAAISPSITSQNSVGCTGAATGSATVTATGGTGGYTYSWTPGGQTTSSISGLTTGAYTVIITDVNGCTAQQMVAITQPASSLGSSISGQNNVNCTGDATGTATVTGTGGTPTYTYLWSTGETTASLAGLTAGTYSVTITDANGCTKDEAVTITQPTSVLGSTISSQSDVNCTGNSTGTATVTGTGGTPTYTYTWTPGGQTTASVTGLTSGTYIVSITDANGCTQDQIVDITEPSSVLTSTINSQNDVGCTGSATGSATVTGIGGTPNYTYSWSPGGQTTASVTGLTSGSYNVIITDDNGCTAQQTVNIMQPASAINSTTSSINATCGNSNGVASVTATGGTPNYTYSWSPSGGTNATATNLASGPYVVTITDDNGCTRTEAVSVNNSGAPTVGISAQTDVLCNGAGTGSATVTATGGTGTLVYTWSPGGYTTTSVTGLTAGTYIVTVVDSNSCAQGQTIIITEPATAINSGISSQNNVNCTGNSTGSATVTATGGTGTLLYSWSPGGETTSSINGLTSGLYSVTITDANGCTSSQSVAITQPASVLSTGVSLLNDVNCKGASTGSVTVTASGGTTAYTYNWSNGETTNTISGLTAGTYSITVTDANGCSLQQVVSIAEPVAPLSINSGSTNAACGSSDGTASVTASGGTPNYTYNWSTGGTTSTLTGLTAGTYSIIVTDTNGCTQNTIVTVNGSPGPSISGTSSTNVTCNGLNNGTATLTTTSGTAPYTYTWTPGTTTTMNTVSNLPPATYTVMVSDSAGCMDTIVITITEPLPITFTLSASNATICAGESLTLQTTTPVGGTAPFTYTWLPNGPIVNPLVPTTYSVTITDSSGCISQVDTIRIVPLAKPIANFDTSSTGMFNVKYIFTDLSTGAITWYWDFGDGTISSLQDPDHTFPGAGIYTVTQIVTAPSGCTDTITKIIIIRPNILIPNVFTPNHDGINDEFWIPNTGFEKFELVIYDRWGLKLFETNQGEIRWDGRTSAGNIVPDGTYYYLLKAKLITEYGGKDYDSKGFIDLHK